MHTYAQLCVRQCSDDVITIPHYSGAQDLHENLLCIGDAAFLGIKSKLTELN